ncbi:YCF48-related protein [Bacteroidota bacterium]
MKTLKALISLYLILLCSGNLSAQVPSPYLYKWFPLNSGTTNDLNMIFSSGSSWIVGENGSIFRMDGDNLTPITSGTTNDLYSMHAHGNFWIVGENGTILKSPDGINWTSVNSGTTNTLYSYARTYINTFTIVGSNGLILRSTNNGDTWSPQASSTTSDLKMINYSSLNSIWIAGSNGTLLKSTDYGLNWIPQNIGTTNDLNVIKMLGNTGYIFGSNGLILKTDNGGLNWTQQVSGTSANLKSYDASGWIVGSSGTILRTTNGGINWILQDSVPSANLNSVKMIGEIGWTIGNAGAFLKRRLDSTYLPYKSFEPNNIGTYIWNTGIFNQPPITNMPSFEWPVGSGNSYVYSSGINIAGYYNNQLRMASASYEGESMFGYCDSGAFYTDNRFKIYKVNRNDSYLSNPDWADWGVMVPFGAPFVDVNHNGTYEPQIDTPGVKNASQTLFVCFTDANPQSHILYEGFGGGTQPLGAEFHLTAWGYNKPIINDIQFLKWEIINKSISSWYNTFFGLFCDHGFNWMSQEYIGCDTMRNLGYGYNAVNELNYQPNPPALGFDILKGPINKYSNPHDSIFMSSFDYFNCGGCYTPPCETTPSGDPSGAYNFLKGTKRDGTPYYNPLSGIRTKCCYPGDPENGIGWTEYDGSVLNCNGDSITGSNVIPVNPPCDRRFLMGSGSVNLTINPGDTQTIIIAQMIARGSNNLNSVTLLKELSDYAQNLYNSGFVIGIEPISSTIPKSYRLHQNYPNPFNPVTKIRFELPKSSFVKLIVYDILGREITKLVNKKLTVGSYETEWDGSGFASGVYFYQLRANDFSETKRMLLIK